MRQTVIHLEKFYTSRLGQAAAEMTGRRLASLWPDMKGKDVLGFGYCGPYLKAYSGQANRVVLAMPAEQGAVAHVGPRGIMACLVEDRLPFPDASFDNVLVAHGAEEEPNIAALLSELWRVTQPEGRIVVISPNRGGLWARSERSPFGAGRPFSKKQLQTALSTAGFVPSVWSGALYVPPIARIAGPGFTRGCERFGETVWPGFSGLVLVEGIKRLYAEPSGHKARLVMRPNFGGKAIGNTASSSSNRQKIESE